MARKKIVFVIVEGPSDDTALGAILSRLYDKNEVHIEITHGDITSDYKIQPDRIVSEIGNIVKRYALSMHFKQSDFLQVIHIVDMDGAFAPDTIIKEDITADKPVYSLSEIMTSRPEKIKERNQHKREVINRISCLPAVWKTIPYSAYYMSCNLDHVLYNKLNSTDLDKENDAYMFAKQYKNDIEGFLHFISDSDFSNMSEYKDSWEYIKQGMHSLERHTNLGICFRDIRKM